MKRKEIVLNSGYKYKPVDEADRKELLAGLKLLDEYFEENMTKSLAKIYLEGFFDDSYGYITAEAITKGIKKAIAKEPYRRSLPSILTLMEYALIEHKEIVRKAEIEVIREKAAAYERFE